MTKTFENGTRNSRIQEPKIHFLFSRKFDHFYWLKYSNINKEIWEQSKKTSRLPANFEASNQLRGFQPKQLIIFESRRSSYKKNY